MSSTYVETWILWSSSIFLKFVVFKNSQFHSENCILRVLLFVTFAFVLFLKMLTAAHTHILYTMASCTVRRFWEKICQLISWNTAFRYKLNVPNRYLISMRILKQIWFLAIFSKLATRVVNYYKTCSVFSQSHRLPFPHCFCGLSWILTNLEQCVASESG